MQVKIKRVHENLILSLRKNMSIYILCYWYNDKENSSAIFIL